MLLKAVALVTAGDAPLLRDEERSVPAARDGHALVRVEAAGVCGHDVLIASGVLRRGVRLPVVLGHEISGVVEAAGAEVAAELIGQRVVVLPGALGHGVDGGFADYVVVPVSALVPVPDTLAPQTAALLACPAGVALKAVRDVGGVRAGEMVLVTGAGGGLGVAAGQVAHALGARVFGVTSSEVRAAALEAKAALENGGWLDAVLIEDGVVPLHEVVRALTDGVGADAVIDTVGGEGTGGLVRSLSHNGRLVLLGQVSAGESRLPAAEVVFREARVLGSLGVEREHVERALELAANGEVASVVDRELPLSAESVGEALHSLRERAVTGRVVLRP